jgi:antitoxin CptB
MAQEAGAPDATELRRLRWQCRRGLLELDLALEKFFERHAAELRRNDLPVLEALLALGDNDLWDLVSGRASCGIPQSEGLLEKLREQWA